MNICVAKKQSTKLWKTAKPRHLLLKNKPSGVSCVDKQLGAKGRERDYLSKLRKGPQVDEETKEEVEKLALEVNDR
jgi:hypothetical protein